MEVKVFDEAKQKYETIGSLQGLANLDVNNANIVARVPLSDPRWSDFDAEQISRVRVVWDSGVRNPDILRAAQEFINAGRAMGDPFAWFAGLFFRKEGFCKVTHVRLTFLKGERIVHATDVFGGSGKINLNADPETYPEGWEDHPLPCELWVLPKTFEGLLIRKADLAKRELQLSDVQTAYEVFPDSFDLTNALRVEALELDNSLVLQIHSVVSTTEIRLRAKIKVLDKTFDEVPEVEGRWPADWVTGPEFCHTYRTGAQVLVALRIQADDTVQREELRGGETAYTHPGTIPVGQKLVASASTKMPAAIYGGGFPVAWSDSSYELVVQRNLPVTGESSPKVLEELHSPSMAPARTFFMEWVGSVPLPVKETRPTGVILLVDQASATTVQAGPRLIEGGEKIKSVTDGAVFLPMLVPSSKAGGVITQEYAIENLKQELWGQQFDDNDIPWNSVRFQPHQSIWLFHTFWHPQAVGFRRVLEARGLPRLMRLENQELSPGNDLPVERGRADYFSRYRPTQFVSQPWPRDVVDFTIDGPFSEYNWELFHDSLVYLTKLFDADGKFEEADEIFSLMIDMAKAGNTGVWEEPQFYRIAPIRYSVATDNDLANDRLAGLIEEGEVRPEIVAQIERINQNPYQPHIIARGWPSIYGRALRIRFADHLIKAGEYHFRRAYQGDSRTDLEMATTRFDFAVRVLGQPEDLLGMAKGDATPCFSSILHSRPDRSPRGIEVLEAYLPGNVLANSILSEGSGGAAHVYFCVPRDEKLDELRAVVADRLSKLRACQDIEGVRRALSLYGQRIDPALLVRATAEGLDLDVVLGQISSAKPTMYFSALWSRAMQACERARALEEAWIGAHERADSEGMALLQNEQEIQTLEMGVETSAQRLQDARLLVEALERTIESAKLRYDFYSTREKISQLEKAESQMLGAAGAADARAATDARTAADWAWVPSVDVFAEAGAGYPDGAYAKAGVSSHMPLGGETAVQFYRALTEGHRNEGAVSRAQVGLLSQSAAQERRFDEWKLSESLAQKDIDRGKQDKAGAEVRVNIADLELQLQKKRVDDAKALRTYMKDKFSNQQLYSWRASRLEQLRYQQQRIAYDLAMQAKAALARELGLENQGPLPDMGNGRTCAAAALSLELEKMQHTYVTMKRSERKKTKAYSLATRQPLAFLELLQRGETIFSIAEHEYDEDAAGDWYRTFSHISITVPAVHGPYSNVNVELTQLSGEIRGKPHASAEAASYPRDGIEDDRFKRDLTTGERIATNTGLQDDGTVGAREDPETPPVFSGNGAISTFRIELKPEQNHFDRHTITDVILHLAINCRYGGENACAAGMEARRIKLVENPTPVMLPLHSAFSNVWYRFLESLSSDSGAELLLKFEDHHIPMHLLPVDRIVQTNLYFGYPDDEEEAELNLVDNNVGEFSRLLRELTPTRGGPLAPLHIQRLKLRRPLSLGEEHRIRFRKASIAPKRGWLICWVEGGSI